MDDLWHLWVVSPADKKKRHIGAHSKDVSLPAISRQLSSEEYGSINGSDYVASQEPNRPHQTPLARF